MRTNFLSNKAALAEKPAPKPQLVVSTTSINLKKAIAPDFVKSEVDKAFDDHKRALMRKRSQADAEVKLEEMGGRVVQLECQRDGRDLLKDARYQRSQQYIGARQDQIACIDEEIATRRARADERIADGPQALAALSDAFTKLVAHLAGGKPLFEDVVKKVGAVKELFTDTAPNGAPQLVAVPKHNQGGSLLNVHERLQSVFGSDYPNLSVLTRLIRDARALGIEI